MIVPAGIIEDQMSAQSFLPSSIRAALSFVSGHATLDQLPFFFLLMVIVEHFAQRD